MIDADLLPHTIDVLTAATVDDGYGNARPNWATATERTVPAYVRPAPASEDIVDRDAVTAVWQVHTNDLNITAADRVRFDGVVYDVHGKPLVWRLLPGGDPGHTKLLLKKVDG